MRDVRHRLCQQIQPLRDQLRLFKDHSGQVGARMGETGDVAFCQRVAVDRSENNRGGAGRRSRKCGLQRGIRADDHDIEPAARKYGRSRRQTAHITVLDEFDCQVAAFDIAQLAQPILKGDIRGVRAWAPGNDTDMENTGRRSVGIGGRSGKADQQSSHEPASDHSMTSSARARINGGIVRPSARAVLRLTTSSSLLACSTGRSAGLAPFRIRSTK